MNNKKKRKGKKKVTKKSNKNRQKSTVLKHFTVYQSVANSHYIPSKREEESFEWCTDH